MYYNNKVKLIHIKNTTKEQSREFYILLRKHIGLCVNSLSLTVAPLGYLLEIPPTTTTTTTL